MASNPFKSFVIPRFKLPGFVSAVGCRLPQWPHAVVLVAGLNALVRMKRLPDDGLGALEGKSFLIDVLDTGARASFTLDPLASGEGLVAGGVGIRGRFTSSFCGACRAPGAEHFARQSGAVGLCFGYTNPPIVTSAQILRRRR